MGILKAAKALFSTAWTPYRLESAIKITCAKDELSMYSEPLKDLLYNHFSDLLV